MVSISQSSSISLLQRLPIELQELIIEGLTTYIRECRGVLTTSHPAHSPSTCGLVPVTHPSVIHLRATNRHFRALIPASHSLFRAIERSSLAIKKKVWACCVCLQMKPCSQFANMKYGSWIIQEPANLAYKKRHRFCFECGTRGANEQRPGIEPRGMTTYAPGTKVIINRVGWAWCMDCRRIKTGDAAGEASCRLFCRDCCRRLDCLGPTADVLTGVIGISIPWLHWGYQATDSTMPLQHGPQHDQADIRAFRTRRWSPNRAARSLLLPDPDNIAGDKDDSGPDDGEWKAWFD